MELAVKIKTPQLKLDHLNEVAKAELSTSVLQFLDIIATATSRASYYNTQKEIEASVLAIHKKLFSLERSIYGMALLLPGVNDYAKQTGLQMLLSHANIAKAEQSILTITQEWMLLQRLVQDLPPQRMLNTFLELKSKKVNNARTRRIILSVLLNSPKLELWSVKYRRKIKEVLVHGWGERTSSIIKNILQKNAVSRDEKENAILKEKLEKYLVGSANKEKVFSAVSFVLGNTTDAKLGLHKAFSTAKTDINAGRILPYEVLEGIRSTYHKNVTNAEVLVLTKNQLSQTQKLVFQRKAEEQKVEISFNPADYDAAKLYIYAYERGMTQEVKDALQQKAQKLAANLPVNFGKTGILVDNSASMQGNDTQKMHPMAIALATKDVLVAASEEAHIVFTQNGSEEIETSGLTNCTGATSIGEKLVELLALNLDSIFIISDGYENAPSGRVYEVLRAAKFLGIETPIIHINPVMAAEAKGVRKLSPEINTFPLNRPEALGIGLIKSILTLDIEKGVSLLFGKCVPLLTNPLK